MSQLAIFLKYFYYFLLLKLQELEAPPDRKSLGLLLVVPASLVTIFLIISSVINIDSQTELYFLFFLGVFAALLSLIPHIRYYRPLPWLKRLRKRDIGITIAAALLLPALVSNMLSPLTNPSIWKPGYDGVDVLSFFIGGGIMYGILLYTRNIFAAIIVHGSYNFIIAMNAYAIVDVFEYLFTYDSALLAVKQFLFIAFSEEFLKLSLAMGFHLILGWRVKVMYIPAICVWVGMHLI